MLSVQDLQETAFDDLERMIDDLAERADQVVAQRVRSPEFTDESEGIGAIAEEAVEILESFLMGPGIWVPSSVGDLVREAHRQFLRTRSHMSDHYAVKARELLEESRRLFQELLQG